MRVLHVIPTLDTHYGGPVAAIHGMVAAQAKAGVEVKLLTTDYGSDGIPASLDCETKVFHCLFDSWQWSPALSKSLPGDVTWADIVNIHTLWTHPTAAAARACWSAGVPYILRPAGMLDEWSLAQKRLKKKIYSSLVERRTINRATALWFTSEEERIGAGPFKYRTRDVVIPLGIALDDYLQMPPKGAFRDQVLRCSGKRFVLFLGRITPKKQPDLIVRAFADLAPNFDDCILVIAGPDEDGYVAALKNLATALGIHDRVFFTGNLQRHDVVAALNDAEVFVLPSLHENFGVAVIEAMASGTPVIVSERVGLASVVKQSEAGIVAEDDEGALVLGLRHILKNPGIGLEMGKRGREVALTRFTWEAIVPTLTAAYERAIRSNDHSGY